MSILYKKGIPGILVMLMVVGGLAGLIVLGGKASAATKFAGGTGTADDPYQISTADQLSEVRNNYAAGTYFKLTANIDLSSFSSGAGWLPIGDDSGLFQGNINGNGFTIANLTINRPTSVNVGLFGKTANSSVITNMMVKNMAVLGKDNVGGLAGKNSGTISSSYTTGSVSGTTSVGGLVGHHAYGTISGSYSLANVSGTSTVGGLVGQNYNATFTNTISNSYAAGMVSGTSFNLGGVVGYNNGMISTSYYDKNTTTRVDTGKGEGKSTAEMKDLATFSGWNFNSDWYMLPDQYPQLWALTALAQGTGFGTTKLMNVAAGMEYSLDGNHYTAITGTSVDNIAVNAGDTITVRVAATPTSKKILDVGLADIQPPAAPAAALAAGTTAGTTKIIHVTSAMEYKVQGGIYMAIAGTSVDNLVMNAGNALLIRVKETAEQPASPAVTLTVSLTDISPGGGAANANFAGGMGTVRDPYQVATADQLDQVRNYFGAGIYFKLTADIDLSSYSSGAGWLPIGEDSSLFNGTINGNGFAITNVTINRPTATNVGLFGKTAYSSVITNMVLKNVAVQGNQNVGGLAGMNSGTISNSYTTGSVSGTSTVGGLVGTHSFGTISKCYSLASVSGTSYIGGLAGQNYNADFDAAITNSYAAGVVSGSGNLGGLIGYNGRTIISSYYDKTTSTRTDTGKGEGKSTAEMQNPATFSGWDFHSDWYMLPGQYPQLWALTALTQGTDIGTTKLVSVAAGMEYSLDGNHYTAITGTSVDHIAANAGNTITVRVATYASSAKTLTVDIADIKPALNSTIGATEGDFDKYAWSAGNSDMTTNLSLNGNTLVSISNDATALVFGTDYTVTGSTVTIKKSYLANQSVGTTILTFAFSAGADQTLTITVSDTTPPNYNVMYSGNGSTGGSAPTDSGSYAQGVTVSVYGNTGNLVKMGYTFAGWNTQADGSGTSYAAGAAFTMGTSNVTLYVKWKSSNADLSGLTLPGSTLNPAFAAATTSYTANVANSMSGITVTATVNDAVYATVTATVYSNAGMVTSGPIALTNGAVSPSLPLNEGNNMINLVVTAQDGTTKTYIVAVNRASNDGAGAESSSGGSAAPKLPSDNESTSADGKLTLPAGRAGEVSLANAVKISIPADASDQELKLTIEKVLQVENLLTNKDILLSPIYEILKNFTENFSKPITLTLSFDPTILKSNQKAAVFYYDETKKSWVEVADGKIGGDRITVEVDHFTKFAVFAADQVSDIPTKAPSTDPKPAIAFHDIAGHWAEASIMQALSGGIVAGYPDGTFKPNHTVTRAEFAVMLMNTLKPQGEGAALTFTDTARIGYWAQKAVAQAVQAGIINGYEDGSFRPDEAITRAEMAAMLANAKGLSVESNAATGFADDKDIPAWAKGAVAAAKESGLIEGKGSNAFDPGAGTTRAESVTVLLRMSARKGT
ncbi:S-layer homology domain-containing protein [Paenibacillus cymbidii]|uniref:S-layer homology domain-containing protein n=1 Tax=Paenibacillus cymbidii TaxID=1639034 RepID=UPI001436C626|nr:S-layer homology domain-containing protein [Paenibacillus cymbidii]